jgi:hypothetical protein
VPSRDAGRRCCLHQSWRRRGAGGLLFLALAWSAVGSGRPARGDRAGQAIGGRRRHPSTDAQPAIRHARYRFRRRRRSSGGDQRARDPGRRLDEAAGEKLVIVVPSPDRKRAAAPARVVAVDKAHDLALLRIDGQALPASPCTKPSRYGRDSRSPSPAFPSAAHSGCRRSRTAASFRRSRRSCCPAPMPASSTPGSCSRSGSGSFDIYQLDATAYPGQQWRPAV